MGVRRYSIIVRITPSHGGNTGSNPVGDANIINLYQTRGGRFPGYVLPEVCVDADIRQPELGPHQHLHATTRYHPRGDLYSVPSEWTPSQYQDDGTRPEHERYSGHDDDVPAPPSSANGLNCASSCQVSNRNPGFELGQRSGANAVSRVRNKMTRVMTAAVTT
jgi:hypothetical protein